MPTLTLTPRTLVAAVGLILAVVGALALLAPVNTWSPGAVDIKVACGNTVTGPTSPEGHRRDCQEAIDGRRAWAWPLTGVGALAVAAAVFVVVPTRTREQLT